MGFIKMPLLAMPVLHKYIPALILNNNQSILGLLDVLTENSVLEYNHDETQRKKSSTFGKSFDA